MKKKLIIAAIITVIVIIGLLLCFFLPKKVSYTFDGMVDHGGFTELHPARLEIYGTEKGDTFEGTIIFTAEGKVHEFEAVAEIVETGAWHITNKNADEDLAFSGLLMADFRKGKCVLIVEDSAVHEMAYNIFTAPATTEDEYYDIMDYITEKFE